MGRQSDVEKNPHANRVFKTRFPSFFLFFFLFTWSVLLLCFFLGSSFAGSFLFCAWVPFFFCRFLSSSSPWVSFFFMFFLVRSSPLFFLGSSAGSFLFCAWVPFFFCRFLSSSSPWVSFFFVFFLFSWGLFFFFLCGSLRLLFFFNFRTSSILQIRL